MQLFEISECNSHPSILLKKKKDTDTKALKKKKKAL